MANKCRISKYILERLDAYVSGAVHSKFETSINIMLGEELFNISSKKEFLSSFGIQVPVKNFGDIHKSIQVGDIVTYKNGVLNLYGTGSPIKLSLDKVPKMDLTLPRGTDQNIIESGILEILAQMNLSESIGIQGSSKTNKVFKYLASSELVDIEVNEEAIVHLVGRGIGLTPSGDDILMGYAMVLMSIQKGKSWISQLESLIDHKTTDVSLAYYKALFNGQVSSIFVELMSSIHLMDKKRMESAIESIGNYGNTSGFDTLFGIYLGCQWVQKI